MALYVGRVAIGWGIVLSRWPLLRRAGSPRAFWVCMLSCAAGATLQVPFVYQQLASSLGDGRYASGVLLSVAVAAALAVRTYGTGHLQRPACQSRPLGLVSGSGCLRGDLGRAHRGAPGHAQRVHWQLWLHGRYLAELGGMAARARDLRLDDAQRMRVLPPLPSGLRPPSGLQGVIAGRCGQCPLPQLGGGARRRARRLAPGGRPGPMEVRGQLGRGADMGREHGGRRRRGLNRSTS